jgi:hypothetical protein
MARRTQIVLEDDLSGGPADETISFALDGNAYEIDLSTDNAAELRTAFQCYIDAGRRVARQSTDATKARTSGTDARSIRDWARAQGIPVPARGRLPSSVLHAFHAAQQPTG